jgi:hypothetical protein
MSDLLVAAISSGGVLLLLLWLPGLVIALYFGRNHSVTLTDAFFLGLLWNVVLGLALTPFTNDAAIIALGARVATTALVLSFILYQYRNYGGLDSTRVRRLFFDTVTLSHVVIVTSVSLIFVSVLATHNVGYDEVSNFEYLYRTIEGSVYPEYRRVVGAWEAARYPMWGLVSSIFINQELERILFIYYFLGISVLAAFVLKIYEFLLDRGLRHLSALAGMAIIAVVLTAGSLDNYFNYGIYPLQQAKLIYILGLLYLINGWWFKRSGVYLILGLGLIHAAVFSHLNLIPLHAVTMFLAVILITIRFRKNQRTMIWKYGIILVFPLVIAMPSAILPSTGFILQIESSNIETQSIEQVGAPAISAGIALSNGETEPRSIFDWLQYGERTAFYLGRAFSIEILLIPIIVGLLLLFGNAIRFPLVIVVSSMLFILTVCAVTISKQIVSSSLRSGAVWMITDILRSGLLNHTEGKIFTDPYTGLFLKLMGSRNIEEMKPGNELLAFSPLFPLECRANAAARLGANNDDRIALNGRYWGEPAVARWSMQHAGGFDVFLDGLREARDLGSIEKLEQAVLYGARAIAQQIDIPILVVNGDLGELGSGCAIGLLNAASQDIQIYRDTAIVSLNDLLVGEKFIFEFEPKEELVVLREQFAYEPGAEPLRLTGGTMLELNKGGKLGERLDFGVVQSSDRVIAVFQLGVGHFYGLGTLRSIVINRQQPNSQF